MEVRADELAIAGPDIAAVGDGVVAGVLTLEVLRPVLVDDVVARGVEHTHVEDVQHAEEASPVAHGADLSEAVLVAETKLVHAAPAPLEGLLAGRTEHVHRDLIPGRLAAVSGVHVPAEEGAARLHHEGAVGGREAHSGVGAAEHVEWRLEKKKRGVLVCFTY